MVLNNEGLLVKKPYGFNIFKRYFRKLIISPEYLLFTNVVKQVKFVIKGCKLVFLRDFTACEHVLIFLIPPLIS